MLMLLHLCAPGQCVTRHTKLLLPGEAVCRRSTLQGRHKRWHRHCLVKLLYSSHAMPVGAAACPFFLHPEIFFCTVKQANADKPQQLCLCPVLGSLDAAWQQTT